MLADTAKELLVVFRRDVADYATYAASQSDALSLWKDDEIYGYMTEACDSLARDTRQLFEVLTLAVIAGEAVVALPRRVVHIREARLVGARQALRPQNANGQPFSRLTDDYGSHRSSSMFVGTGTPSFYVRDYNAGAIRLAPTPVADDEIELQCSVTVANRVEAEDDLPFAEAVDQRLLLSYMKWRAYEKQDAETEDLVRAKRHQDDYETRVVDREQSFRNQVRTPGFVRMEW